MGAWKRPLIFQYVVTSSSAAKKCREPTGMKRGRRGTEGVRGGKMTREHKRKEFWFLCKSYNAFKTFHSVRF